MQPARISRKQSNGVTQNRFFIVPITSGRNASGQSECRQFVCGTRKGTFVTLSVPAFSNWQPASFLRIGYVAAFDSPDAVGLFYPLPDLSIDFHLVAVLALFRCVLLLPVHVKTHHFTTSGQREVPFGRRNNDCLSRRRRAELLRQIHCNSESIPLHGEFNILHD